MTTMTEVQLEAGREYNVRMFPRTMVLRGKYVGKSNGINVFSARMGGLEGHLCVVEEIMCVENSDVSHLKGSSQPVVFLKKGETYAPEELKRYHAALNELGVDA